MPQKWKPPAAGRGCSGVHIEAAKLDAPDTTAVRIKAQRQAERIHALGPRPLSELIAEIIGRHPDLAERVAAYAAIDPAVVRALGANRYPPLLASIEGGRSRP
jgi:hypothetical protein